MKVTAICCQSYRHSTRRAAGVEPLLSPPHNMYTLDPAWFGNCDLLYVKLHGLPDQPYWYGDNWLTVVSAEMIRQADLSGCVIFVAACHLPESPMLSALLKAGAAAVIGGSGINYAGKRSITGADLLGMIFRQAYTIIRNPVIAFKIAKGYLLTCNTRTKAFQDTARFRLYTSAGVVRAGEDTYA